MNSSNGTFGSAFDQNAGKGQLTSGQSVGTFFASLAAALVIFGVQLSLFILIKGRLPRIYQPRTYLVPEKERTLAPPTGFWRWVIPVFKTSNSDFIQKCGLDAYFFLRYLRLLLKIFIPLSLVILPILLPLNAVGGRGPSFAVGGFNNSLAGWNNVTGLDQLAWGNVRPDQTNRYWAHLLLAVLVISYTCWVFFDELRGYIRLRQAYLTSPQHRLRASATTVLVTAIPKKWCTVEALDGLYDVFPGGIRNIWVNRNFDELQEKINQRNKWALALEAAETSLIKNAKVAYTKQVKRDAKKAGKKQTKTEMVAEKKRADEQANAIASTGGVSTGDPHQVRHTLDEALGEESNQASREQSLHEERKKPFVPIPIVGQGIEAVGQGFSNLGKTVFGGIKNVGKEVDDRLYNTGFVESQDFTDLPSTDHNRNVAFPSQSQHHNDSAVPASRSQRLPRGPPQDIDPQIDATHSHGLDGHGNTEIDSRVVRKDSNRLRQERNLTASAPSGSNPLKFWKVGRNDVYNIPSPTPHGQEEDEFPLSDPNSTTLDHEISRPSDGAHSATTPEGAEKSKFGLGVLKKSEHQPEIDYPIAFDDSFDPDNDGEPKWKKYLKDGDRATMRLPVASWMPSLPFVGRNVDTITYCRKEVARLNVEIEEDQRDPHRFPVMNSAFVQFNHQIAAHMCCQSISHHIPNHMAPRAVEISPGDVLWDNMSITWWQRYIRTAVVIVFIFGLIIGWAVPVYFTGSLSQVNYLVTQYPWLAWLGRAPAWLLAIIQGILPQLLLGLLLLLLPLILRYMAKIQGLTTGMAVELATSDFYFAFLFVQIFLIVSISTALTTVLAQITSGPQNVPTILATNLPKAANYFFSYLLLQALSVSAGALLQVTSLLGWFILSPLFDNTARDKWARQINLPQMQWGTFFPVYTNLAVIGLIYSVIAPLIMVFNIITFGLFWIVYRYNTLYVTKFRFDTGGLLFPKAINQSFTGLYVMELALIGLFLLVRNADSSGQPTGVPCLPQAIIMIVVLVCTILFQFLLNNAFGPLFRYLPITLEDDAVIRDEQFARAQEKKWNMVEDEQDGDDINEVLEKRERRSAEEDDLAEEIELQDIQERRKSRGILDPRKLGSIVSDAFTNNNPKKGSWADRSKREQSSKTTDFSKTFDAQKALEYRRRLQRAVQKDVEAQTTAATHIGEALFSGLNDEIEDLTPQERDLLVQRAFQHEALRAKRPVIWIPRDELGISDDEIYRTQRLSEHIWISNEYTGLDGKARVVYRRSPPDFSEVDLIDL